MLATRSEALRRLAAFQPEMGDAYAARRNYDLGVQSTVSRLSPWLRRRLLTEAEVIAAAVQAHGAQNAAKFIDEVVWRSYFKGWLELRPAIWRDYVEGIAGDHANLDAGQRQRMADLLRGESGIACLDAWVEDLTTTGYPHNHARMWFASIWVFALGLPWRLGADFFLRHLLDGDPASNTLGWRWVAGLHTPGKTYHAEAGNIAAFTKGRQFPDAAQIARRYGAPVEPMGLPAPLPLRRPIAPDSRWPSLLLITEEDGCPQDFDLAALDIRGRLALTASHLRSPDGVSRHVAQFETAGLVDTLARLGSATSAICPATDPAILIAHASAVGARQIVTPYVPTGPLRDWLEDVAPHLEAAGLTLAEWRRPWDEMIWPDCGAGFFKVKAQIPRYLAASGVLQPSDRKVTS